MGSLQRNRLPAYLRTMAAKSDSHHLVVVGLETAIVPFPKLDLPAPYTYELREYGRTLPHQTAERIRDADIVVLTVHPLGAELLRAEASPRLKMVGIVASGTDSVDLAACKARGIHVANTPNCNVGAVVEHAIALYFSVRRSIPLINSRTRAGDWPGQPFALLKRLDGPDDKPPRLCARETMGIVGYGAVGKRLAAVARALGMDVLIAGRKGESTAPEGRTPFDTVLRESSVLVLSLPRSPETLNLISTAELDVMAPHAVLVNISRGGIVDEPALVAALKARKIAGAATDVYLQEPAGLENSPLLTPDTEGLNLVTTPHVAWCAEDTNYNYNQALRENISTWLGGKPTNTVV